MADKAGGAFFTRLGEWMKSSRPTVTWIYCSAILFPMAFALAAAAILRYRQAEAGTLGFFALFYLALMVTLAAVPRSILPILLIWLTVARFKPAWDDNRMVRYAGLFLLMAVTVSVHAWVYGHGFNVPWLISGWLSVALPRLAFPMLREGLGMRA